LTPILLYRDVISGRPLWQCGQNKLETKMNGDQGRVTKSTLTSFSASADLLLNIEILEGRDLLALLDGHLRQDQLLEDVRVGPRCRETTPIAGVVVSSAPTRYHKFLGRHFDANC